MITVEQLKRIMPLAGERAGRFCDALNAAMDEFGIDTPVRQAAFIAQLAHESGEFRYVEEIASGAAYENRADLGNVQPGDGVRFKGRGLIQITGRANYAAVSAALGYDFVADPESLEDTDYACRSAAWFWKSRGLNAIADLGDFQRITKRINGGLNGYGHRLGYWERAKQVLA